MRRIGHIRNISYLIPQNYFTKLTINEHWEHEIFYVLD